LDPPFVTHASINTPDACVGPYDPPSAYRTLCYRGKLPPTFSVSQLVPLHCRSPGRVWIVLFPGAAWRAVTLSLKDGCFQAYLPCRVSARASFSLAGY